jgi:hypothetical protein
MDNKEIFKDVHIMSLDTIFNENAIVLSNKTGIEFIKSFEPIEKHIYIVFGGHKYPVELIKKQEEMNYNFGYIILNSESQLSDVIRNKYYIFLMKKNIVYNYSSGVADYLNETHSIKNYSYFFFDFMKLNNEIKLYDYTFIGSRSLNREKILNDLKKEFPYKSFYINFDWDNKNPLSIKTILSKTKYLLNIPFYENDNNLEIHRIHNGLSAGCQVVSIKSGNEDTDNFYDEYIYFTDDFIKFFKSHEVKKKKDYDELTKLLSGKWLIHNMFILKKIVDTRFKKNSRYTI